MRRMVLKAVPDPQPQTLAALYGRQSKSNKESISEQLDRLRTVCGDEGWDVYDEYEDGVSASRFTTKKRKHWPRLLADLEAGQFRILMLWESSRGDRDLPSWVAMLARCRELGVRIYVDTHQRLYDMDRPRDWKTLVDDGTESAYSSEETSLRWRRHTAARAADGKPHGFVRYGWIRRAVLDDNGAAIGKEDIVQPEQAQVVRDAATALLDGESLRSIVARLNADETPSPRGGRWSSTQLRQILLRASNAGLRVHRGEVIGKGNWEPLYNEDTHTRIVTKLTAPDRLTSKGATRRWQGSHLYICGRPECGGSMRVISLPAYRGRKPRTTYQCIDCMRVSRSQPKVDEVVDRVMIARLSEPDAVEALALGDPERVRELRDQIAGLEARLLSFADQAADGAIDAAQLARINAKLKPQITAAKAELATCHPNPGIMRIAGPQAEEIWHDPKTPLSLKRAVISALAEITILPAGRGARFDPESVHFRWKDPGET